MPVRMPASVATACGRSPEGVSAAGTGSAGGPADGLCTGTASAGGAWVSGTGCAAGGACVSGAVCAAGASTGCSGCGGTGCSGCGATAAGWSTLTGAGADTTTSGSAGWSANGGPAGRLAARRVRGPALAGAPFASATAGDAAPRLVWPPPDCWSLMAAIRSFLRIRAVPAMPSPAASSWSSDSTMPDNPAARRRVLPASAAGCSVATGPASAGAVETASPGGAPTAAGAGSVAEGSTSRPGVPVKVSVVSLKCGFLPCEGRRQGRRHGPVERRPRGRLVLPTRPADGREPDVPEGALLTPTRATPGNCLARYVVRKSRRWGLADPGTPETGENRIWSAKNAPAGGLLLESLRAPPLTEQQGGSPACSRCMRNSRRRGADPGRPGTDLARQRANRPPIGRRSAADQRPSGSSWAPETSTGGSCASQPRGACGVRSTPSGANASTVGPAPEITAGTPDSRSVRTSAALLGIAGAR